MVRGGPEPQLSDRTGTVQQSLLQRLMLGKYGIIIDSKKKSDDSSLQEKKKAWIHLTKEFNEKSPGNVSTHT